MQTEADRVEEKVVESVKEGRLKQTLPQVTVDSRPKRYISSFNTSVGTNLQSYSMSHP